MATATTPSEIDVRWELANNGRPTRYSKSGEISLTFTRRHERVDAALGEIAAMLVQDGVWPEERQEGDDSLRGADRNDLGDDREALQGMGGPGTRAPGPHHCPAGRQEG